MTPPKVHVHRIVLDGFSPAEQRAVLQSVRQALATTEAPSASATITGVTPAPVPAKAPHIGAAVRAALRGR